MAAVTPQTIVEAIDRVQLARGRASKQDGNLKAASEAALHYLFSIAASCGTGTPSLPLWVLPLLPGFPSQCSTAFKHYHSLGSCPGELMGVWLT